MKKLLFSIILVFLFVLAGCQTPADPDTGVSEAPPFDGPVDVPTLQTAVLQEFVSGFDIHYVQKNIYDGEGSHQLCPLTEKQSDNIREILNMNSWVAATDIPEISLDAHYVLCDEAGNSMFIADWDTERALALVKDPDTGAPSYLYSIPPAVLDQFNDYMSGLSFLPGVISYPEDQYYDLFRADPGLIVLVDQANEDVSFSDDQLAAYAIQSMAYQGGYDYETGNTTAEYDAVTQRHFGRSIQNFDNSMSKTLDNGRVTATGWSFDGSVHLVLDHVVEEKSGVVTAVFRCYFLSDSLWTEETISQHKLEHRREYLLAGADEDFPAPSLVEVSFEIRNDDAGSYVFYHSLKVLD